MLAHYWTYPCSLLLALVHFTTKIQLMHEPWQEDPRTEKPRAKGTGLKQEETMHTSQNLDALDDVIFFLEKSATLLQANCCCNQRGHAVATFYLRVAQPRTPCF